MRQVIQIVTKDPEEGKFKIQREFEIRPDLVEDFEDETAIEKILDEICEDGFDKFGSEFETEVICSNDSGKSWKNSSKIKKSKEGEPSSSIIGLILLRNKNKKLLMKAIDKFQKDQE